MTEAQILSHVLERLDGLADGISEVKGELIAHTHQLEQLNNKVAIQNGGVKAALSDLAAHKDEHAAADNVAKGRRLQRADDMAKLDAVQSFFEEWKTVIMAAGMGLLLLMAGGGLVWGLVL